MQRQNISSGTLWESQAAYSRAVRVGSYVHVSGTTAADEEGQIIGHGDLYEQSVYIIKKIDKALAEAGASLRDVVRTRMYVTNIDDWQQAARAHKEFFDNILPAATMVEVSRLIDPEMLIEIEVDAFTDTEH